GWPTTPPTGRRGRRAPPSRRRHRPSSLRWRVLRPARYGRRRVSSEPIMARTSIIAALAALALLLAPCGARAAYPERVITLIVPFAAGGPTDIIARIVSVAFQKSLGQSVVVENRRGGGGDPRMAIAARGPP